LPVAQAGPAAVGSYLCNIEEAISLTDEYSQGEDAQRASVDYSQGVIGMIQHLSAVTLAVQDMPRSVEFYQQLGLEVISGSRHSAFTTLRSCDAFVNLVATPGYQGRWWGRVIFRVDDAHAHYRALQTQGLAVEAPQEAPWGERFFHLTDPDGHELSFAELLPARS
jgi:catechol 2,3-dioxygenase-like lactoylglutathione lyase family enzyme